MDDPALRTASLATHRGWLLSVLRSRLGDAATADDLWQEVALAYLKNGPPESDRAAPWLYRTALKQVLMHRRTVGRRLRREARYAQERDEARRPSDPLGWLVAGERQAMLRAAIERLAPQDAEILMLRYGHDLPSRDIASRLGISPPAVDQRLSRARRRLREEMTSLDGADFGNASASPVSATSWDSAPSSGLPSHASPPRRNDDASNHGEPARSESHAGRSSPTSSSVITSRRT